TRGQLGGGDAVGHQRVTGQRPDILPGHTLAPGSRRDEPENHLDISLGGRRPTPKSIASLENRISLLIPSGHGARSQGRYGSGRRPSNRTGMPSHRCFQRNGNCQKETTLTSTNPATLIASASPLAVNGVTCV